MRKLGLVMAVAALVAACGGGTDEANGEGSSDSGGNGATARFDPCTLADDSMLASYFGEAAVERETGEAGPIVTCTWRDANANSLSVQVASNHPLFRPDPCRGCVDLSFGDDGYATGSLLQSTAKWVAGTDWYSVTTTGFGDDVDSIADLGEKIFQNATG